MTTNLHPKLLILCVDAIIS